MSSAERAMRVYIASPLENAPKVRELAAEVTAARFTVVSTWHREGVASVDPEDLLVRQGIVDELLFDLKRADVVIAYVPVGIPRGTFVEVGIALAHGLPIVWCHSPTVSGMARGRNIFDAHRLVERISTREHLLPALRRAVARAA